MDRTRPDDSTEAANGLSAVERLDALERLLDGGRAAELDRLHRRVEGWTVRAEHLSDALPGALAEEVASGRLGRSMQPAVEEAIESSVRRDPHRLVDAIFPVMGPAIRKAVGAAIRGMTDNLNQVLEHSFSVRGLRWRMEAARTGRPFAEVVLLNSLVWRVEQVFLIHRETGLCVARAAAPGHGLVDADTVSGMLVALQEYVRTSFGQEGGDGDGELTNLEVGEHLVWVESGPHAALAAVIVGSPPTELRGTMQAALESVHAIAGERLKGWSGDSDSVLEGLATYLEDCLQSRRASESSGGLKKGGAVLVLIGFALVMAPVLWAFHRHGLREHWEACRAALADQPGIVVTGAAPEDGVLEIVGLRDPLSADPTDLLRAVDPDLERVRATWRPFNSLDPEIVLARTTARLAPPADVRLALDGTTLSIHAPAAPAAPGAPMTQDWLELARERALSVPGVERVELVLTADREDS